MKSPCPGEAIQNPETPNPNCIVVAASFSHKHARVSKLQELSSTGHGSAASCRFFLAAVPFGATYNAAQKQLIYKQRA